MPSDNRLDPARTPLRIGVLMMPGQVPLDLAGPLQVLQCAERLSKGVEVDFFGPESGIDWHSPLQLVGIAPLPEPPDRMDLLLVPGTYSDSHVPSAEQAAIAWLKRHANKANTVMAVCSGALLLARAGLLAHRRCTTHHSLVETLAGLAPRADVRRDCIFVEHGDLLTSAGITTGIDTMLYWLAGRRGPRHVAMIAREMVLFLRRSGQEPQLSPWLQGRNHVDARLHGLQDVLGARMTEDWPLARMAQQAAMSERQLRRQFSARIGMTPGEYLTRLRLQSARQLMRDTDWPLSRIAAEVGLGSDRQLRRCWQRHESDSPQRWRQMIRPS